MSAPELVPPSGRIEDGIHYYPLRVYYEDTDAGGIVYHASYLRFAERARTELLRLQGWGQERMIAEIGLYWVVKRAEIDYVKPARLEEALIVATSIAAATNASVEVRQIIRRGERDLARLKLQLVLLTPQGRVARIPEILEAALLPIRGDCPPSPLSPT